MKRGEIGEIDLHAFVDGELDPPLALDVKKHLDAHSADTTRVEAWRAQNNALRRAFEPVTREGVPVALSLKPAIAAARVAQPDTDPPRIDLRAIRRRRRVVSSVTTFLGGAAVAMLVALGLPRLHLMSPDATEIIEMSASGAVATARRARLAWRTYVREIDRSAEYPNPGVETLARIAGLTHVPDLSSQQFHFVTARIMPGEAEPAAFLLYVTPEMHRVAFIIERSSGQDADQVLFDDGGLRCLVWRTGGYSYAMVGPAGAETLRTMARTAGISLVQR
jgi:anti-sigma factor RsiW